MHKYSILTNGLPSIEEIDDLDYDLFYLHCLDVERKCIEEPKEKLEKCNHHALLIYMVNNILSYLIN